MTKIYVGNLPFSATESEVRDLFAQHGTVDSVALPTDRETGRPRGFGFVEMPQADAQKAMQALNGFNMGGRPLRVNEAQDRPRTGGGGRPGGGGGGGRGGFGGGGGGGGGRISSTGTFELGNLTDARLIRVSAPQGWMLKAVTLNGQDLTDTPIDVPPGQHLAGLRVEITQKIGAVTGTVVDARKQPVLDATVVLFPADERLRTVQSRFTRTARPDQEGTFRITGLPPGDYRAVALQGLEDGQDGDPDFLASIEDLATRLALEEGESRALTLELARR